MVSSPHLLLPTKEFSASDNSRPMLHMYGSALFFLLQAAVSDAQLTGRPSRHDQHQFTPSMAIILVVLISAFFLMAFFSVYLRLCAGEVRSGGSLRRSGNRARSRRPARRGVDRAVIDTFPVFEYSAVKGLKLGREALECAVCLNEFEDDDNLRLLPVCSHVFHPDCIDSWLASHTTCPVCRANLVTPDPITNAPLSQTPDPEAAATEDETRDEVPLHPVVIEVCEEEENQDPSNQTPVPTQNVPIRSKSTRLPFRFPRSHTTGHSLLQPGENVDKFTLRLPEQVRKEIVAGKMNRSASYAAFRTGSRSVSVGTSDSPAQKVDEERAEESGRGRFQWRFDRAAKSDRWAFLTPPSFFWRSFSVRSQKRADGEQTANQKSVLQSVRTPFDCIEGKAEGKTDQNPVRSSNPVFTISAHSRGETVSCALSDARRLGHT